MTTRLQLRRILLIVLCSAMPAAVHGQPSHIEEYRVFSIERAGTTLRGTVAADGTVLRGAGFTVTVTAPERYLVTFTAQFATVPSVVVSAQGEDPATAHAIVDTGSGAVTAGGFHAATSGALAFDFVAVGQGLPDFVVSPPIPPATAPIGGSVTLGTTIENVGSAHSLITTRMRFYLWSTTRPPYDGSLPPSSLSLSGYRNVFGLPPRSPMAVTIALGVPASFPPGDYYVVVCADVQNVEPEQSETNNCAISATTMQLQ
jgi:hypothetical protein